LRSCACVHFAALVGVVCLSFPGLLASPQKSPPPSASKSATAVKRSGSPQDRAERPYTKDDASKLGAPAQMTLTPERYREIQQALIDKGYLQAPASGVWGPDCSQALKKFQQEQNLTPNGKLERPVGSSHWGWDPVGNPIAPRPWSKQPAPSSGGLKLV